MKILTLIFTLFHKIKSIFIVSGLSQEEKFDVLRRLQEKSRPGDIIEVSSRELKWIGTNDFNKTRMEL